jgi:hypothetical protein
MYIVHTHIIMTQICATQGYRHRQEDNYEYYNEVSVITTKQINWIITLLQRFIYLLVSLSNITMTEDSITDYLLLHEGTYCEVRIQSLFII